MTSLALSRAAVAAIALMLCGAVCSVAAPAPAVVVPDADPQWSRLLNGVWQFHYVSGTREDPGFVRPEFDATAWSRIAVPGHWELQGFAEPKYKRVDEGTGFYRTTFGVPREWRDRRVFLRFEGVLYGLEAWVNGHAVGAWASSYNPVTFDVTDALNGNGDNVLAVRVTTHPKGWEFDTNDCWALSGIYRDVRLFSVPAAHLRDYAVTTAVRADGTASVTIHGEVEGGSANDTVTITGHLQAPGAGVAEELAFTAKGNAADATVRLAKPALWSAETPALYGLTLQLRANGNVIEEVHDRVGVREVTIADGVLKLNGAPIKLRGVDHHDIWPDVGRATNEKLIRQDLELMRAANINFVRTSHYPPHRRMIELCDELGLYVMCEVPFGFGDSHLTDESYRQILQTRAAATLARDRNRPSVIIWSVGNENPITPLQLDTGREVKRLDPTRPICFPTGGGYFDQHWQEFPEFVDLYAAHYPSLATLRHYAEVLKRPVIMTEYAHSLGLAMDRMQDEWEFMRSNARIAGGAVWMFQDQGIRRTAAQAVDVTQPTVYAWPDAKTYFDTAQTDGVDGIVYSDRNPQLDYWQVRKVYSPVQITEREVRSTPGRATIPLHVENRFDFRSLDGLQLGWELQRNGVVVSRGSAALHARAHQAEVVPLSVDTPSAGADVLLLAVRVHDERGVSFHERSIRLRVDGAPSPAAALQTATAAAASALSVDESTAEIRVTTSGGTVCLNRQTGTIALRQGNRVLVAGVGPHLGRAFTMAERVRGTRNPAIAAWAGCDLEHPGSISTEIHRSTQSVILSVRAAYPREDKPGEAAVGHHDVVVEANGKITVRYDYALEHATGTLLEAGLSLVAPAALSEFRWIGAGPFASYPGKDRLNEFGVYHLSRDDIRFQGNRQMVELALLTDTTGRGVAVWSPEGDWAVERRNGAVTLSHNALVAGRGNKAVPPEVTLDATKAGRVQGNFTLVLVESNWPGLVERWFGNPAAPATVQKPYFHSYDQ